MRKYFLFIIILLLTSTLANAQSKDRLDYLNLQVGARSTNTFIDDDFLESIVSPIEHTASYSYNFIQKIRVRITLYRNSEKIYSKIFVKDVSLSPTDLDYITFYIGKRFPFRINYDDSFDTSFEFLPTDY